ncbi:MAG TPA: inositol monophosphatase family protein [Vicinamibacterales bacterium]|nr:inositol monophosphatase family protein [Vicinamibacterales bacterium]
MAPDPRWLATAVEGALAAGRIHRAFFRQHPEVSKKGPIDLVTAADLAAEREFRALVAARFPTHVVLGEEYGDPGPGSGFRWIVDPLDGTTNFAHGLALFSVSIALEIDGRVDVGAVFDPIAEELYTAERGQGTRLNGQRLRVTSTADLADCLLCTGFPYSVREKPARQVEVFAAFLREARAVRRLGSAALDLCYIAAGRFDGFWEDGLQAWDVAAGALIVEEAGGRVTDFAGAPLDLASGRIVASNGAAHDAMRRVILEG